MLIRSSLAESTLVLTQIISSSSVAMTTWFWLCTSISLGLLYFMAEGKPEERNFWIVLNQYSSKRVVKELFEDQNCILTQLRNRSYLDCNLILQRNVERVELEAQLDMLRPNNQMIRLYNIRLDACEFWTLVHNNPLVNILAKSFIKVIDKNLKCPLISVG